MRVLAAITWWVTLWTWWFLRSIPAQSSVPPPSGRRRVLPAVSFLPRIRNTVPGAPVGGTSSARAMALEGQEQVQRHQTGASLHPRLKDICTIVDHAQVATLAYYSIHDILKILSKTKHNIRVTQRKVSDVGASYCIIQYTDEREDTLTHRIISVAGSRNQKNWNQNIDTNLETDEFLKKAGLLDKAHRGYLTVYRAVLADFLAEEQRTANAAAGGGAPVPVVVVPAVAGGAALNAAPVAAVDVDVSNTGASNTSVTSTSTNGTSATASIATAASAVAAALAPAVTSYTATSSRNVSAVPPALSKTICITGHSLGGAVACLLALGLKGHGYDVDQVTIFGTPKFTDKRGAEQIAQSKLRISRFEHVWDPAVFSPVAMPQPEKIAMGMTVGRNIFGGLAGAAVGSLAGIAMTDVYSDLDKNTLILLEPLSPANAWVPPPDSNGNSNSLNNEQAPPIAFVGGALSLLVGSGGADGDRVTRGPHRVVAGKDAASRASIVARLRDLPGVDWRWHSMHAYHDLLRQYRDRYFLQEYYRQQTAKPAVAAVTADAGTSARAADNPATTDSTNAPRQR